MIATSEAPPVTNTDPEVLVYDQDKVLSEEAAEVIVGSVVTTDLEEPKKAITDSERALWDQNVKVEKAKEAFKFAKHGYSRKERKEAVSEEAARLELKIKAERQASGQIPTLLPIGGNIKLDRAINKLERKIVMKREMKRAVGDAKAFAKNTVKEREQAASIRLYETRQAYKDIKHQNSEARFQAGQTRLNSKFNSDGSRKYYGLMPRRMKIVPRRWIEPKISS